MIESAMPVRQVDIEWAEREIEKIEQEKKIA